MYINKDNLVQLVDTLSLKKVESPIVTNRLLDSGNYTTGWGYDEYGRYFVVLPKLVVVNRSQNIKTGKVEENRYIESGHIILFQRYASETSVIVSSGIAHDGIFHSLIRDWEFESLLDVLTRNKVGTVYDGKAGYLSSWAIYLAKDETKDGCYHKAKCYHRATEKDKLLFVVKIGKEEVKYTFNKLMETLAIIPNTTTIEMIAFMISQAEKAKRHIKDNEIAKAKKHISTIIKTGKLQG